MPKDFAIFFVSLVPVFDLACLRGVGHMFEKHTSRRSCVLRDIYLTLLQYQKSPHRPHLSNDTFLSPQEWQASFPPCFMFCAWILSFRASRSGRRRGISWRVSSGLFPFASSCRVSTCMPSAISCIISIVQPLQPCCSG